MIARCVPKQGKYKACRPKKCAHDPSAMPTGAGELPDDFPPKS